MLLKFNNETKLSSMLYNFTKTTTRAQHVLNFAFIPCRAGGKI
jgi:hypothetical protein